MDYTSHSPFSFLNDLDSNGQMAGIVHDIILAPNADSEQKHRVITLSLKDNKEFLNLYDDWRQQMCHRIPSSVAKLLTPQQQQKAAQYFDSGEHNLLLSGLYRISKEACEKMSEWLNKTDDPSTRNEAIFEEAGEILEHWHLNRQQDPSVYASNTPETPGTENDEWVQFERSECESGDHMKDNSQGRNSSHHCESATFSFAAVNDVFSRHTYAPSEVDSLLNLRSQSPYLDSTKLYCHSYSQNKNSPYPDPGHSKPQAHDIVQQENVGFGCSFDTSTKPPKQPCSGFNAPSPKIRLQQPWQQHSPNPRQAKNDWEHESTASSRFNKNERNPMFTESSGIHPTSTYTTQASPTSMDHAPVTVTQSQFLSLLSAVTNFFNGQYYGEMTSALVPRSPTAQQTSRSTTSAPPPAQTAPYNEGTLSVPTENTSQSPSHEHRADCTCTCNNKHSPSAKSTNVHDHHWNTPQTKEPEADRQPQTKATQEQLQPVSIQKKKSPEVETCNILLIGESGSGKTTFINGFKNYLSFPSMDDLPKTGPIVLVDTSFTTTDEKFKMVNVRELATKKKTGSMLKQSEYTKADGVSSTKEPMDHLFQWTNDKGETKILRLIDTPGVNDTRGADQDEANNEKIWNHINRLGDLHAIVILMESNSSRITTGFRACFDKMFSKLHRNAANNIFFCFTSVSATGYKPGDSLPTLRTYLENFREQTGIQIKADRNNIFCFENACIRYLLTLKHFPKACKGLNREEFSKGWTHNVTEVQSMLNAITTMEAHDVEETLIVNDIHKMITVISRPLTEAVKNHLLNIRMIKAKIVELAQLKRTGASLKGQAEQKQITMTTVPLKYPRTICTSLACCKYEKINNMDVLVPKYICHDKCKTDGIVNDCVNNENIKKCEIFLFANQDHCKVCNCHWRSHKHITYDVVRSEEKVSDSETIERCQKTRSRLEQIDVLLNVHKTKLNRFESELEHMLTYAAECAASLKANALKQRFDPFIDNLSHLIEEEETKTHLGVQDTIINELKHLLTDYISLVKYLVKKNQKNGQILTTEMIEEMVDRLGRMKHCGSAFNQVKNLLMRNEIRL